MQRHRRRAGRVGASRGLRTVGCRRGCRCRRCRADTGEFPTHRCRRSSLVDDHVVQGSAAEQGEVRARAGEDTTRSLGIDDVAGRPRGHCRAQRCRYSVVPDRRGQQRDLRSARLILQHLSEVGREELAVIGREGAGVGRERRRRCRCTRSQQPRSARDPYPTHREDLRHAQAARLAAPMLRRARRKPTRSASRRATNCAYAEEKARGVGRLRDQLGWRPRRESNPHLALRRRSFYPLNYGGGNGRNAQNHSSRFSLALI